MKRTLNPKLNNETTVKVDDSSNEEDTKSKEMEEIFSQALENIEENIKLIPKMPIKVYVDNGKGVTPYLKEGTRLIPLEIEQKMESVDAQILKHNFEHQKVHVDENLNEEEMNQHLDTSKERLPIEENLLKS